MPYVPFYEIFRTLAILETRTIMIRNHPNLPDDDYGFFEVFCSDENCDCRRVMFYVQARNHEEIVAVIAYGWESKEFYAKWYRNNDPEIIQELQGPILNLGSRQSELAPALLDLVRNNLLLDPEYIERIKRHYRMFKEKIDPDHFRSSNNQPTSTTRRRHRPYTK